MKHELIPVPGVAQSAHRRASRSPLSALALALTMLATSSMALPQIRVSVIAMEDTAREAPADDGLFLVRRVGGSPHGSASIRYELSGSASPGDDYAPLPDRITLEGGVSEVSLRIEVPGDDGLFEGDETVTIRLLGSDEDDDDDDDDDEAVVVVDGPATVTIIDSQHEVTISRASHASESPTSAGRFEVALDGRNESGDSLRVEYSVAGSATPGSDYGALSGEAVIRSGSSSASIEVTPLDDDLAEDDETVEVTLTGTSNSGVAVGEPDTASLSIQDDDEADSGGGGGGGDGGDGGDDEGEQGTPEGDTDGDLVPGAVEIEQGSDPYDSDSFADSDGGGTADYIEVLVFPDHGLQATDPQDPGDDRRDTDGDGLPDRLEIMIGADAQSSDSPTANGAGDDSANGISNAVEGYLASVGIESLEELSDFDRDGYPDVAEIGLGLSPVRAAAKDSDGDGVPDVIELLAGGDIDAATDRDGDGIPDARELGIGSDPLDANSPIANGSLDDDGDGVSNAVEHLLQILLGATDIDADGDSDDDGLSDAEEIRLGTAPLHKEQPVPWIELTQSKVGPVRAIGTDSGEVSARALVGGPQGGLSYDWRGTDNAILAVSSGSPAGKMLSFSPATLPADRYNVVLRVQRTAGDFSAPESVVAFTVNVVPAAQASDIADADSDGIPDSVDDSDARSGLANTLPAQSAALMRANPGVRLQLGSTARTAQTMSANVSLEDVMGAGESAPAGNVGDFDFLSGLYDFEVTNLPEAGAVVQIVIPQARPIGEFPEYRKLLPDGWSDFTDNASNTLESAPGSESACPPPGDDSYQPGLTPGHFCIQLGIEDGGPNDGDAALGPNGVIKDPGGVGTPKGQVVAGQGGGAAGPAALVALLGWLLCRRRRPAAGVAALSLAVLLVSAPPDAYADAFVGAGIGVSQLDPDTAGTNFSSTENQDFGYKVFGGVDLTPISRKLSIEAFWADLGQATLERRGSIDYSLYGVGASFGLGSSNTPRLSAFVKAGVARLDINANVPFRQEDETSLYMGVAGAFALRRHIFLQLEYNYFTKDAQFLSLSLVKRFRTEGPSQVKTIPLPED